LVFLNTPNHKHAHRGLQLDHLASNWFQREKMEWKYTIWERKKLNQCEIQAWDLKLKKQLPLIRVMRKITLIF
jgi:hypothetical protein